MSVLGSIAYTMSLGGVVFNQATAPSADSMIVQKVTVPAAKAGDLTTRTDADTGVVTVDDSGHSFIDTDRVDLYWDGGCRRGMAVSGVPSGAAVTIDGGNGDDLPVQDTAVTMIEPLLLDISVLGTNVNAIMLATAKLGQFVFVNVSDAEQYWRKIGAAFAWSWEENNGQVNPITGDQIEGVYLSHGEITAVEMKVGILHDN